MRRSSVFASVAGALALAGCVAPSQPAPRPAPPVPLPTPTPPPLPTPTLSADWRDWPLTPGNWSYRQDARGSAALFGAGGQEPELTLRCDRIRSRIQIVRRGAAPSAALTVRTTSLARTLGVAPGAALPAAEVDARDALVDAMGYSRGRFLVQQTGLPTLVVPAWAEILRVAEDCRG